MPGKPIDWSYVKKTTLWQYDELLKKLNAVFDYPVIRQAYNHSMPQAADFAQRLFPDKNLSSGEFPAPIIATITRQQAAGVRDWSDLLGRVATRADCEGFIEQNDLSFEGVIDLLNYMLRWAFPFHTATRELLNHDHPQEMAVFPTIKQHKLMCSFDLLERGFTAAHRQSLVGQTGLPLNLITSLVHRADIARLPYVRRKTIIPLCEAGYNTLAKIAGADLEEMEAAMVDYYQRTQGKSWEDFKSVIVLRLLVTWAKALPKIQN